jgi:predicted nuclease with TOPRIM domain
MSDWRITAESLTYQDALRATESIEEPAYGFIKPSDVTRGTTAALIKQNNTIIQLLVKLKEDLEDCKSAIKRLEAAKTKIPESQDLSDSIQKLQTDLQKLSLGESSEKKIQRPTGKFYVYKNPKDIFDSIKKQQ